MTTILFLIVGAEWVPMPAVPKSITEDWKIGSEVEVSLGEMVRN